MVPAPRNKALKPPPLELSPIAGNFFASNFMSNFLSHTSSALSATDFLDSMYLNSEVDIALSADLTKLVLGHDVVNGAYDDADARSMVQIKRIMAIPHRVLNTISFGILIMDRSMLDYVDKERITPCSYYYFNELCLTILPEVLF
jgi:hypothetical protein